MCEPCVLGDGVASTVCVRSDSLSAPGCINFSLFFFFFASSIRGSSRWVKRRVTFKFSSRVVWLSTRAIKIFETWARE